MKKSLLLVAALAAITSFSSCSKDESPVTGDNVLVVKLPGAKSRAVEDPITALTGGNLNNVTVFLMNGNSKVDTYTLSTAERTAGEARIEQVASSINRVIVVANIPSADVTGINAEATAGAILNYPFTVASQNGTAGIADKTMIGDAPVTAQTLPGEIGTSDGDNYKEALVELTSLISRIEVGDVKPGDGIVSVDLVGVWINNYYATNAKGSPVLNDNASTFWYTSTATGVSSTPYSTITMTNAYVPAQYYDAYSATVTTAGTKAYAYHVFSGNLPHLILLVKGEYETGHFTGADKYFLKYVTFSSFKNGATPITTFAANTIYKVGVTTGGIEITPDIVTDKPETQKYDLGINVTVAAWTTVTATPGV